jgi:hypothetical protein
MMSRKLKQPKRPALLPHDGSGAGSEFWNALILRVSAVAAQAATIWITWPLWLVRHYDPAAAAPQCPMLPVLPLPQFDVVWPLLASLAVVMLAPRWGVALHGLLLVWAILLDQIRMQPECISLLILMAGSLGSPNLKLLARSHLIALWFFAGFHKLISPGFYESVIPFIALPAPGTVSLGDQIIGVGTAILEIMLAVLAVVPRTRWLCAIVAVPFHLAIVWRLALELHWNESICPWNVALAVASVTLIWPWRTTLLIEWRAALRPLRAAVAFVLFSPLLFYVGLLDPFLAYCLYAQNTPEASIYVPNGGTPTIISTILDTKVNVPIPPEHRLFEAYFEQVAQPGETLVIEDPRWCARYWGYAHREIVKPPAATPAGK